MPGLIGLRHVQIQAAVIVGHVLLNGVIKRYKDFLVYTILFDVDVSAKDHIRPFPWRDKHKV